MRKASLALGGIGLAMALGLSACTNPYDPGQRAVGGGLLGTGAGAAIGGAVGGTRRSHWSGIRRGRLVQSPARQPHRRRHRDTNGRTAKPYRRMTAKDKIDDSAVAFGRCETERTLSGCRSPPHFGS